MVLVRVREKGSSDLSSNHCHQVAVHRSQALFGKNGFVQYTGNVRRVQVTKLGLALQIWNGHFEESDSILTEELGHTCSMLACIGGSPCTIHMRLRSGRYRFLKNFLDAPQSMGHSQQHNCIRIKNLP
jgi:hypothetical protein